MTESIPFPPRNGRELPTAEIFRLIAERAEVDLLVISNDSVDYENRIGNLPPMIHCIGKLNFFVNRKNSERLWKEILGERPGYFSRSFDENAIKSLMDSRKYDLIWVSPANLYTFVEVVKKNIPQAISKVAIGMNDLKSGMYYDAINEAIGFRTLHPPYLLRWIRSFFMSRAEKNYLKDVDFIHMQTQSEATKVLRLFQNISTTDKPNIFFAPNGRKTNLSICAYSGKNSNNILYMTQFDGERMIESRWFLNKVWPQILKEIPEAQLLIPGKIEDINSTQLTFLKKAKNVNLLGFVESLTELFDQVRLCVVPIFHGTGLINRILDSLTAGVPTISTYNAGSTFPNLEPEKHFICANTHNKFAQQTVRLFNDINLRQQLSEAGRNYANKHPTWQDTANKIYSTIQPEHGKSK